MESSRLLAPVITHDSMTGSTRVDPRDHQMASTLFEADWVSTDAPLGCGRGLVAGYRLGVSGSLGMADMLITGDGTLESHRSL